MSHEMEVFGSQGRDLIGKNVMAIMDPTGDTKIIWDADVKDEVDNARTTFNSLLKKGFSAFKVNKKGEAGERITEFDAQAEKLILVPAMQGG
jgi:hypothetical protein